MAEGTSRYRRALDLRSEGLVADSPAFAWLCGELEAATSLDRLESRGTVRIALKNAGLEAGTVRPDQMRVVIERLLPEELRARGVEGREALCARWASEVEAIGSEGGPEAPDEVFRRIGSA